MKKVNSLDIFICRITPAFLNKNITSSTIQVVPIAGE